ncbi:hypothetical protein ACIBQ1_51660 [Nonomuraea sp. NPDC050153]|uniref:hypothetical protein n=1 Tax=Nonomuraea sp. NPDC050153 TaxID=3364359 RepID=UPI00379CDC2A
MEEPEYDPQQDPIRKTMANYNRRKRWIQEASGNLTPAQLDRSLRNQVASNDSE